MSLPACRKAGDTLRVSGYDRPMMHSLHHQSQRFHGLCAMMLACVLALRLLVPMGYMPVQTHQGIAITLCTGEGAQAAVLQIPLQQQEQKPQGTPADHLVPCLFSALSISAVTGDVGPPPTLLRIIAQPLLPPFLAQAVLAAFTRWMPPPIGPPASH